MVKTELEIRLSDKFSGTLSHQNIKASIDTILEHIATNLSKGDRIEIRGFGCFSIRNRRAKTGRNPKTGEPVTVPPKSFPYFKPGLELRDRVNVGLTDDY